MRATPDRAQHPEHGRGCVVRAARASIGRHTLALLSAATLAATATLAAVSDPASAVGPTVPNRGTTATTRPATATTKKPTATTRATTRTTARSASRRTATTRRAAATASVRGDFSVSVQDEVVGVAPGATASTRVFINGTDGFASAVTMSPRDIPIGVSVRVFSPIRESARVDISVDDDVPDGSYPVAIRGTAGGKSRTAEFVIQVGADAETTPAVGGPTTTAPPIGGIARPIAPTPGTDTSTTITATATTTTLVGAATTTVPGAVTTTPGPVPTDVVISLVPATLSVAAGSSGTLAVVVAVNVATTGNLTLAVSGLPPGATGTLAPATLLSGLSTLTITVPASVPPGTYPFTVTATAGSLVRTGRGSLTVTPAPTTTTLPFIGISTTLPGTTPTTAPTGAAGDLAISVSSPVVTVANGSSGAIPVTVTGALANGALISVAGAPAPVAVLVSPNPVTTGTATVTFFVNGGTPPASTAITITARNGAVSRQVIVLLTTT